MKKILLILLVLANSVCFSQSQEVKQLQLNVEKLAQLKALLSSMKKGYEVIHKGTTAIRDIASGNFNLHKEFLDGLLEISPAVRKYKKIADIISYQLAIVKNYTSAFRQFKVEKAFTIDEIAYMGKVYSNLLSASLTNLDELLLVITAGQLRMSDDERMLAIDKIYTPIEDQFNFLQDFNNSAQYLSLQRNSEKAGIELSKKIHGY